MKSIFSTIQVLDIVSNVYKTEIVYDNKYGLLEPSTCRSCAVTQAPSTGYIDPDMADVEMGDGLFTMKGGLLEGTIIDALPDYEYGVTYVPLFAMSLFPMFWPMLVGIFSVAGKPGTIDNMGPLVKAMISRWGYEIPKYRWVIRNRFGITPKQAAAAIAEDTVEHLGQVFCIQAERAVVSQVGNIKIGGDQERMIQRCSMRRRPLPQTICHW